ncbi:hypothetical protein MBT84_22630 [Streptomyces sp. MBT84]|nr:hypothetical protein [Streptomyces sp. MBT84]
MPSGLRRRVPGGAMVVSFKGSCRVWAGGAAVCGPVKVARMGVEIRAQGATEAKSRTCLRCDNPLPARRIPRLFCSPRHAAQAAFAALLFVFAVERIGLRFAWRLMHAVLGITNVLSWFGWG